MRYLVLVSFIVLSYVSYSQAQRSYADSLLHCLIGKWNGKGTSFGTAVEDRISFDTTIRSRFLYMKLSALTGDDFEAEGYLWYNPAKDSVEFYEFNTGRWPVRILRGKAEANMITLEEHIDARHIRITFHIMKDSFKLEEARIIGGQKEVFVNEIFTRTR